MSQDAKEPTVVRMGRVLDGAAATEDVCMVHENIQAQWSEAMLAIGQLAQEARHQSSWVFIMRLGWRSTLGTRAYACTSAWAVLV